ncbi:hypothetical protein DID88_007171 [Monilinia fructigena]|uniref:FMP27 WPPW domain-containing protein n=1 Tax=Monilinia fructigena TaxID=38457 RepID=A0A395J7H6_9HELO|nr:hypothetical protein DID88_007171 [Monilinia fructigena]
MFLTMPSSSRKKRDQHPTDGRRLAIHVRGFESFVVEATEKADIPSQFPREKCLGTILAISTLRMRCASAVLRRAFVRTYADVAEAEEAARATSYKSDASTLLSPVTSPGGFAWPGQDDEEFAFGVKELVTVDFRSTLIQVKAHMPSDPELIVDLREKRQMRSSGEMHEEKTIDIATNAIRLAVPHQLVMHKVLDNVVNTSKLWSNFIIDSRQALMKDGAFEWKLGAIYRAGLIEQQQRMAREAAFDVKAKKIEEEEMRRDTHRYRNRSAHPRGRSTNKEDSSRRHKSAGDDLQDERSPRTRGRKFRYDPEGTCGISGTANIPISEAHDRLQRHNAQSWKRRIDRIYGISKESMKSLRGVFWGPDELPDDMEETENILEVPQRPALMSTLISDLHITVDKPSFPMNQLPDFLYKMGKSIPRDMKYSFLVPMNVQIDMGEARVTLRDYPLPLLHVPAIKPGQSPRMPAWSLKTDFVIAEEFRGPELILLNETGFWDKLRLSFHSRIDVAWKGDGDVHLTLKGTRDPYIVTGDGAGFLMCWRNDTVVNTFSPYPTSVTKLAYLLSEANDSDSVVSADSFRRGASFKKVVMKLSGNVQWLVGLMFERDLDDGTRSFDFEPHYNVVTKEVQYCKAPPGQEYDAFRGFRSHHIHMSIAVKAPVDHAEDYSDDVVSATGLKMRLDSFMLDMHQRREEFNTQDKGRNTQTKTSAIKLHRAQLDLLSADIRAVSASIAGTTPEDLQKASAPTLVSQLERGQTDLSHFDIPDNDFTWIDMDDFVELDWILPAEANPETKIMPLAYAPRFTYFRQTDHGDNIAGDPERTSPFGNEPTHFCIMSKDDDPRRVQCQLITERLIQLGKQIEDHTEALESAEWAFMQDQQNPTLRSQYEQLNKHGPFLQNKKVFLESMKSRMVERVNTNDPRTIPDGDEDADYDATRSSPNGHGIEAEVIDEDSPSGDFVSDFNNRFVIHNMQLKWNNLLRNIILRYIHQVSQRRGFVYYLSRRAVKFILDIVEEQNKAKNPRPATAQTGEPSIKSTSRAQTPDDAAETAASQQVEDRIKEILADGKKFVNADDPQGHESVHRVSTDQLKSNIASEFTPQNSYHVRLIAPQIQLQSEKNPKSVVMVTAKGMELKVVEVMDKHRIF